MDNGANNLPSSILGDGRKFVSLLKNYLKGLQDDINEKLGEVTKIYNSVADTPDTIDEQVHSITVEEKAVNGNISLLVKWNSDNIKKYAGAVIDIKIGDFHTTLAGFSTQQWVKHYETTKTNQYLIDNIEPGQNYLIRVRGKNVYNAKSIEAKAPMISHYVEPNKHVPRPPYEGTVVFDKRGAYWSWKQYDQNQYMWTELRLDEHPGNLFNRLEVTTDLHSEVKPFGRTGTGYLYNRGVGNSYSAPFKIPYAKAVPRAPGNLTIKHVADGLYIKFDKIPEDCFGANLYINSEKIELKENEYTYICSTGTYVIKVAYVDIFGEGTMSSPKTVTVQETIDPEVYKNESLSYKRIADAQKKIQEVRTAIDSVDRGVTSKITQLSNAIDAKVSDSNKQNESRITSTANSINSTVRELQGKVGTITSSTIPSLQSNITQLSNSIDLKVSNANKALTGQEIVSRINVSPNGVSILGKYVHITGDTVIDGNVITSKHIGDKAVVGTKIAEGAITTDKISANAITSAKIASNAITSDKISSKAITSDHMEVDSIEGNRIKSSSIDADRLKANSITGDKLVADSITGDKLVAGSITGNKIKTGSITADKIKVDSLSSITANVGTLTGGTITGSTIIGTTLQNASGTFSVSPEGVIKGATIDAQSFRKSGFEITALKTEFYTVADGTLVPCPDGYNREDCIYVVLTGRKFKSVAHEHHGYNMERNPDGIKFYKLFPNLSEMKFVGTNAGVYDGQEYSADSGYNDIRVGIDSSYIVIVKKENRDSWSNKHNSGRSRTLYTGYVDILCIATKK